MLSAVIFDFDGVIVNTEPLHFRAMQEVLAPLGLGYSWEDYVAVYIGFDDRDALRERFKRADKTLADADLPDLVRRKADAFERLVIAEGAVPYPGVVRFIRSLVGQIPVALCSGALRRDVTPILARLHLDRCFNVMVTADDVKASKPDPESYLLAVERLKKAYPNVGIRPEACVAVEDTPAGISAAKGAGVKVLALPNSYDQAKLADADLVVESLETVSLEGLAKMLDPAR